MRRVLTYVAAVWEILIGALLITPQGIVCIACGLPVQAPGYIGETAVRIVGIVAIVLGVVGIATAGGARAGSAGG